MIAVHATSGAVLASNVRSAHSMWARLLGLMGRSRLDDGEAILIEPCSSIHTCFMRFSIDVLFLDEHDRVLKVISDLRPYRVALGGGARRVLEAAAGSVARTGVHAGDQLEFVDSR